MNNEDKIDEENRELSIYSPQTLEQIEQTGLNLSTESLREIKDIMSDTSGRLMGAMDHYGQLTEHLIDLMNRDEEAFIEKSKAELIEDWTPKAHGEWNVPRQKIKECNDLRIWQKYKEAKVTMRYDSHRVMELFFEHHLEGMDVPDRILCMDALVQHSQASAIDYTHCIAELLSRYYKMLGPERFRGALKFLLSREPDPSNYRSAINSLTSALPHLKSLGSDLIANEAIFHAVLQGYGEGLMKLKQVCKRPDLFEKVALKCLETKLIGDSYGFSRILGAFSKLGDDLEGYEDVLYVLSGLKKMGDYSLTWWDFEKACQEDTEDTEEIEKAKLMYDCIQLVCPNEDALGSNREIYSNGIYNLFHAALNRRSKDDLNVFLEFVKGHSQRRHPHLSQFFIRMLYVKEPLSPEVLAQEWEEGAAWFYELLMEDEVAAKNVARLFIATTRDREIAPFFFEIFKENHEAGAMLAHIITNNSYDLIDLIYPNKDLVRFYIDLIQGGQEDLCKKLFKMKDGISGDLEKTKIGVVYLDEIDHFDKRAFEKFARIYASEGKEKAREMIRGIRKNASGLIAAEPPIALREHEEYGLYVHYVFPEGNYSNYETNLACGDAMEHLEGYQYEKEGYPTQMTGLLGYQLKEGQAENVELLEDYSERFSKIRSFVASRDPDNESLQKAFEEKVNGIFERGVDERFKSLKDLTLKEKLLVLALNVIIKRARQEPYDYDVGDLIVEYKYAFHENLENYIRQTADETSRFKDAVSKNFNLWRELSVIYGENLKHVLRHDLFEEFERDSKNKTEIESVYDSLIASGSTFELAEKQKARFTAIFDNPRIPAEKKADALKSTALNIFSSNIKFKSEEEKGHFAESVRRLVDEFAAGDLNSDRFFAETIPRLVRLRARSLSNLYGKLEELFNADINLISQEVAKYDEVTEVEIKQTQMGGEKSKAVEKSAKKRKIRGFITKTKETANARMGAYLCISGDQEMWKNPNYFELVLKDEESGKCVGVVMLLNIEAEDGKKYLWFGPNPFEGFLGQVSSEQCYKYMYDTVTGFANENGYNGVVVPSSEAQILGACTNRGGDFPDLIKRSMLRDSAGSLKVVKYGKKHQLGGSYGYEDGALVWERA